MNCDKCGEALDEINIYRFRDKQLCDDCYIDMMVGTPDIDFSKLPPEVQSRLRNIKRGWNRNRPNKHHYRNPPTSMKSPRGSA